ncbi:zwei Ig domain protein zig-8-like isoform X2 [Atheta coriaria]|uniref:zwei Ig domain protein zig-8-like isoform X2 n=1 Tax=Dalotia coriaria TaxID=877792 RepID=UPI0031F3C2B4
MRRTMAFWIFLLCLTYGTHSVLCAVQSSGSAAGNSLADGGGGSGGGAGGAGGSAANAARGPHFDIAYSKNVTALLGKTAYLNCRVKNLANRTVSWVRHRDVHLLTVGRYTYTSDQRFRAIHQPHTEDWILQIKYPQHRDSGIYECQVSSTPHLSHFIHLTVIEPDTEIVGGPELFIDRGSTINLTCVVRHSPEPPAYIYWNHNDAIISYSSARGGVSVATERGETSRSVLLIQKARPTDSGNYQCNPSNARPANVTVHVLNGEHPEAMQHGGNQRMGSTVNVFALLTILLLTTYC